MKAGRATQDFRRETRAQPARTKGNSGTQVHVVVITSDFSLLSVLQQAGTPEHAFWQTTSADAAVDLLVSGRRGILILDLATLSGNLTNLLYRLELQFPELVVLATGTREQESSVVTLVGKGRIYRFLHKPVSPARAGLFLSTATRRYLDTRQGGSNPLTAVKGIAAIRPPRTVLLSAAGVLLALVMGGGFLLVRSKDAAKPSVAASVNVAAPTQRPLPMAAAPAPVREAPTPAAAPDTAGMLSRYLAVAQAAYSAGRLFSPPGDNALEYYRSVLRLQANNAEALLGIERINITLETRVTKALQDFDVPAAAQALDDFQRVQPDAPQLAALRTRILALTPAAGPQPVAVRRAPQQLAAISPSRVAPTPPASTAPAAANASVRMVAANVEQARNRIRSGRLIEPADDNALLFLRRAQEAGEDSSVLRIAATDLGQRLLDAVRSAWAANQSVQAQRLLDVANELDRQFDLGLPDLDSMMAENKRVAAAERTRAQRLAAAVQARESGQLVGPLGASAYDRITALLAEYPNSEDVRAERQRLATALVSSGESALNNNNRTRAQIFSERATSLLPDLPEVVAFAKKLAEQPVVVSSANLKRIRDVLKYPRAAERRGIEGAVDVDFTIAPDGTTRDVVVRNSTPKQVFDKAAIDAVSQTVFQPVIRDGEAVATRTTVKIQFTLNMPP